MLRCRLVSLISLLLLLSAGCSANETEMDFEYPIDAKNRATDGMMMFYVPQATFDLSETGKGGPGNHTVRLDGYWIDQTEITNAHFKLCVESGACSPPTTCTWGEPTFDDLSYDNHPVICVTWQMAVSYCEWAGGRLPSEAEWDYAARGPERTIYAWGNTFDPDNLNFCDTNCPKSDSQQHNSNDGYAMTAPVGSFPGGASWCGAMDMNGNVWEWVSDWFASYTTNSQENPIGPNSGEERVIRGGSWYDDPDYLRADHRHPYNPTDYNHLIGFRCVVDSTP